MQYECPNCKNPISEHNSRQALECAKAIIKNELEYSQEYKNTEEYAQRIRVNQEYGEYR